MKEVRRAMGAVLAGTFLLAACSPAKDAAALASGTANSNVASNQTAATPAAGIAAPVATPAAANRTLTITAFAFGVRSSDNDLWWAFTIRNENAAEAADLISVEVAFTDAAGTVLGTADTSNIAVLGPGVHTGIAGAAFFSGAKNAAKMTVQALPAQWEESQPLPQFTVSGATFIDDRFFEKVTATIKSPFTKGARGVSVAAIGVDAAGKIVGSGGTGVQYVPAGGTAAIEASYHGAKPASVAVYAQLDLPN